MSIQSRSKSYNYYKMNSRNAYGELVLPSNATGSLEMDIEIYQQSIKDNILYNGAQFIGLTAQEITDNYIIDYGGKYLKVLYVNNNGRLKQVYLAEV